MPLLWRFSLLSLVVIAALGVALAHVLKGQITSRALADAERTTALIARVALAPALSPQNPIGSLVPARFDELDAALADRQIRAAGVERVKIYDRDGTLRYSDQRAKIGQRDEVEDDMRAAFGGEIVSGLSHGSDHRGAASTTLLEVYVPLRARGVTRPVGAFELYASYAPVAAQIRHDARIVYGVLALTLVLLYAALFRIVARASRALRRSADEHRHRAHHDDLTGLPNRALLAARLERAGVRGHGAALLLIGLDDFKAVNDTLGHDHGDQLLREVGARLRTVVRDGDTLARVGGDEFALVAEAVPNRGAVAELAIRIEQALEPPLDAEGFAVQVEASIGVALLPEHGTDPVTLLRRADVALHAAKLSGSKIGTYDAAHDPHTPERLALLGELRRALEREELILHYQPIAELDGSGVVGVEALVRWQHPERGLLGPDEFVPLAARTSVIGPLTAFVLEAALRQQRTWRDAGYDLSIAVNVAGPNLSDPSLHGTVEALLRASGTDPGRLVLELSEHTVMHDPEGAIATLERLRALGVRLSLDDFGTGRSSLAYLKRLPLHEVKIDRSFVRDLPADESDAAIVRSTIDLARNLRLSVVAEGVETRAAWDELAALGCDLAQGYLLSRPLPAADLTAWLLQVQSPVLADA